MSMNPTAAITARNMMGRCFTMPTDVMTESMEKMASRITIWAITCQNAALVVFFCVSMGEPSRRSCISIVPLKRRNVPPPIRMKSRQEKPWPKRCTTGCVRLTTQAMTESRTRRVSRARPRPTRNACLRSDFGRVEARIEIKTRLSIPRTISSRIRVPSPAQAEGSATHAKSQSGICQQPPSGRFQGQKKGLPAPFCRSRSGPEPGSREIILSAELTSLQERVRCACSP